MHIVQQSPDIQFREVVGLGGWMHTVRQEDEQQVVLGIGPDEGVGEARVTIAGHGS